VTHQILNTPAGRAIKCLTCGSVSFNANDIEQLYCGKCHKFHLDRKDAAPEAIRQMELYAWIGEDDQIDRAKRTGEWGIKQGMCPAGYIPLVAVRRDKVERFADNFNKQARAMGKKIRLVRFVYAEIISETDEGE